MDKLVLIHDIAYTRTFPTCKQEAADKPNESSRSQATTQHKLI